MLRRSILVFINGMRIEEKGLCRALPPRSGGLAHLDIVLPSDQGIVIIAPFRSFSVLTWFEPLDITLTWG
jgi:hypothetical protein